MWLVVHDICNNELYINAQKICAIYNNKYCSVIECDGGLKYFVEECVNDIIHIMREREEGLSRQW